MPPGFESDIFFWRRDTKNGTPRAGRVRFFDCDTEIHEARFAEKKQKNIIDLLQKSVLCNIIMTALSLLTISAGAIFGGNPKWQSILLPFTKNAARYK